MIRLDNIGKQNGRQILFIEASAALQKGEKVGLVGPNGAGKTTLFRMITGEDHPDEGQVGVGRGAGVAGAAGLKELEAAMADPDRADEMEDIVARYGEVQARFEELDGYAF